MRLKIELTETDLKRLIVREIERMLCDIEVEEASVIVEVKATQNYKSEWELGAFRASYEYVAA